MCANRISFQTEMSCSRLTPVVVVDTTSTLSDFHSFISIALVLFEVALSVGILIYSEHL